MSNTKDLKEVKEYAVKLEQYEEELREYNKHYKEYKELSSRIEELKERYIRFESGLNKIPEQYQDKVYNYAYEAGHSNGYSEVLNELYDLVQIFN